MTKKEPKWSDEFDEKFSQMDLSTESIFRGNIYRAKDFLKDFISAQIRQARQQERARVREMIEGMKKMKIEPDWDDSNWAINDGYNTAIQDLLEKLNESK